MISSPGVRPSLPYLLAALTALGPFTIDTYLLAFPAIGADLNATQLQVQQTMTAYLATFTFMMLWHGAIADALGRRRVILAGLVMYFLSTLFCLFATSIEWLWIGRGLQGACAGTGFVVSRAIVRDLYDGALAQRLMARIGMLFGIAPAIAPVVGGAIFSLLGWRGIFGFLACYASAVWVLCWYHLPETLPVDKRQSLHPVSLWRGYRGILGSGEFLRLCFAQSLIFNGVFIYILAASAFVIGHLRLTPQSFAWLFVPVVLGMVAGNYVSSRFAGKLTQRRSIAIGFLLMAAAATWNVAYNLHGLPSVPWAVLPLAFYNLGMFLAMISLQMLALDLFPDRRGMASSCQGTVQNGVTTLVAGVVVPLLWDTTLHMALGMTAFMVAGGLLFLFARAGRESSKLPRM